MFESHSAQRWAKYFVAGAGYLQGDAAVRHSGGAFTFHGRSDEVINVGGNRIGTEEIESALLVDTKRADSSLRNCAVVGMPDRVLGTVPVAFLVLQGDSTLSSQDEARLRELVKTRLSSVAIPAKFVVIPALPETYSGKFMRRLLQMVLEQVPLGDLGALRNPDCVEPLQLAVRTSFAKAASAPVLKRTSLSSLSNVPESAVMAGADFSSSSGSLLIVTQILTRMSSLDIISPSKPLMHVGIDSLSATHFVSELEQETGLSLSPTLVFEHSTAEAVAQHLDQLMGIEPRSLRLAPAVGSVFTDSVQPAITGVDSRWVSGISSSPSRGFLSATSFDAVGEAPTQRWVLEQSHSDGSAQEHLRTSRFLGTVRGVQLFDGDRFAVTLAEATRMDPAQRLLLEHSYMALLTGGMARADMPGGDTGVFLGITNTDFALLLVASESVYAATGGAISIAAGRTSYVLGLQGPCESIDTACSSAIAALHSASLCLGAGDCAAALTTAVNLVLAPHVSVSYARAGMLSLQGRCRTFDVGASGYVRSECVGGILVAHPMQLAARVSLRSTAVRQDGMSASLTAPNGSAQATLLSLATARAAMTLARLGCVESHGTGTPLGDPTEVRALATALPAQGVAHCALGGVKANVGHSEPAAGMVGLVKLVDMLDTTLATPNAQLRILNPHLAPSVGTNLAVLVQASLVKKGAVSAGVSSFGYSGTITHAVLSAIPPDATEQQTMPLASTVQPPPFRRQAFYWESPPTRAVAPLAGRVPFLGVPITADASNQLIWEQTFAAHEILFLRDHRVGHVALLPGT